MQPRILTERLIIRELLPEDAPGLYAMDRDPEVHRYVGQRPLKTLEQACAVIDLVRQQYTDHGIGRWAVLDRETGEFLGWTGFKKITEPANGPVGSYDFGYRHPQQAWGRGIATEAARAALQHGLQVLNLRPLHAMTDVNNGASRRVLEKLGFRFAGIVTFDTNPGWRTDDDLTATWYEGPAEE